MNPILQLIHSRHDGKQCGIPSYCTANSLVISAILRDAAKHNRTVLIEATANQVDQFGGYTGKKPKDYATFIEAIANNAGCDRKNVILGGDHLGPLTFAAEPEESAMKKAVELVSEYVKAGFQKIHLDTSMKLADDPPGALDKSVVARRGAMLCRAAEDAFDEYRLLNPNAEHPVYIIGSEVPIPGGATEKEESIQVTTPNDCEETLEIYRETFYQQRLRAAWEYVVGIVVQPGVEFGDETVFKYDEERAKSLMSVLRKYPDMVFEGHSTDYQPEECLKQMVANGVAILKVGPALTYAMREGLFALSHMEELLVCENERANFPDVLETAMIKQPKYWIRHYHGTEADKRLARQYSLSDRARYYIGDGKVEEACKKLMNNLCNVSIPLGLIFQYFPQLSERVLLEKIRPTAKDLLEQVIILELEKYTNACAG